MPIVRTLRHFLVLGSLSAALIANITWASSGTDGVLTQLRADDLDTIEKGEKVYQAQCAACHGENLEGQADWRTRGDDGLLPAPPHDASGHTWHHPDDLLFEITKYGAAAVIGDPEYRANMPIYKNLLSDAEIVAVLSYIKSTWPAEQTQWQEEVNASVTGQPLPTKSGSSILDKLTK